MTSKTLEIEIVERLFRAYQL